MQNDSLGARMKVYENAYRTYMTCRLPVIIRIDGKAFHTFTRGFKRPFDDAVCHSMKETAAALCRSVEGCKLAYTQSDEVSLVLRNDDELTTQPWFGNNLQKIVSVSASIATQAFSNAFCRYVSEKYFRPSIYEKEDKEAKRRLMDCYNKYIDRADKILFDSRAFVLPENEVVNYFVWRQQDAIRNSIEASARELFSQKELFKKSCLEQQAMMKEAGFEWENLPIYQKRGLCIVKRKHEVCGAVRKHWEPDYGIPVFSQDRDYIINEVWECRDK